MMGGNFGQKGYRRRYERKEYIRFVIVWLHKTKESEMKKLEMDVQIRNTRGQENNASVTRSTHEKKIPKNIQYQNKHLKIQPLQINLHIQQDFSWPKIKKISLYNWLHTKYKTKYKHAHLQNKM